MEKLPILRKQYGLSQQKLADKIGVSRSTVAMWETGASNPDTSMVAKLASVFNTSSDYLIGISEFPHKVPDSIEIFPQPFFRLAKEAQKLGLSERDVDAILNLYRSHLEKNE